MGRRSGGHPNHFAIRLDFHLPTGETGNYSFQIVGRGGTCGSLRPSLPGGASSRTQILVTSHSPDLLDDPNISTDSLLAVESREGVTYCISLHSMRPDGPCCATGFLLLENYCAKTSSLPTPPLSPRSNRISSLNSLNSPNHERLFHRSHRRGKRRGRSCSWEVASLPRGKFATLQSCQLHVFGGKIGGACFKRAHRWWERDFITGKLNWKRCRGR